MIKFCFNAEKNSIFCEAEWSKVHEITKIANRSDITFCSSPSIFDRFMKGIQLKNYNVLAINLPPPRQFHCRYS